MIHAVLIFNTSGKPRLVKFYDYYSPDIQQQITEQTFRVISNRSHAECHFVETDLKNGIRSSDLLLMYRQYATLYVVFCVDKAENELAILDLIQIFVEAMDRCFESVCELDIIFNMDKIHYILNEIIMGGLVIETNLEEILEKYRTQVQLHKSSTDKAAKTASNIRNSFDLEGRFKELKKTVKQKIKHSSKKQ
ncbi:PREDICTED: AP-3 complex subunit sigma-like [Rhagoletis zephyria]|uniref:AP-3 complex subunit sigma-like n=1 Tax=Rhagoletis zephyria TaxID=28612 RepID=UPI0008116CA9|nr:PREDICTED: AP-3 complex subunit sigma-like [Rhagoletis zephyria]